VSEVREVGRASSASENSQGHDRELGSADEMTTIAQ
jgi:hypothetical protein